MSRRAGAVALAIGLLGFSTAARADSITITDSFSGIAVLAHASEGGVDVRRSLPFTQADVISQFLTAGAGSVTASASASLISSYADPMHMSGTGSATASFDSTAGSGDVSGSSQFALRFQLLTHHTYDLDAIFGASGDRSQEENGVVSIANRGWVLASLYRDLTPVFAGAWFDDARLTRSGVLAPGNYYLYLQSAAIGFNVPPGFAHVTASSDFAFRFDLTESAAPVPEPASLLLLGSGLVGVVRVVRRRRQLEG
jgi:hypothetical protein